MATTNIGLGATQQELQGTASPDASYEPLRDYRKICSMNQDGSFVWQSHWEWLGWVQKLEEVRSQGVTGTELLVLVDGDSDMAAACICMLGQRRVQKRNSGFY